MTEREIFLAALKQPGAGERAAFLDQACGSDANLRGQIEALLAEHEQLGSYLESPVAAAKRTVDEPKVAERPGTNIGPYKLLQQIGEGGIPATSGRIISSVGISSSRGSTRRRSAITRRRWACAPITYSGPRKLDHQLSYSGEPGKG